MNMNEFLGGKYLAKTDVDYAGAVATMSKVTNEPVGPEMEIRPILYFLGDTLKPMVLNKTNIKIMVAMFGPESTSWYGQQINVFNDPTVSFNGSQGGLRVRPVPGQPMAHTSKQMAFNFQAAPAKPAFKDDDLSSMDVPQ